MDRAPRCNPGASVPTLAWPMILVLVASLAGCGGAEGDCEDLCAMEAQCSADPSYSDIDAIPFDEEACRSTCSAFAEEDPAYADGVADRVACLEEQLDSGGGCFPCSFDGS